MIVVDEREEVKDSYKEDTVDMSMHNGETLREWMDRLHIRALTTKEVAQRLGVSSYRVNQLMQEPCPNCGERTYEREGKHVEVIDYFSKVGCERCHYTTFRLPSWRLHSGSKAPHMIAEIDLELEDIKYRPAGYPKEKK